METADLDELDELPEVGAVTAETMIEYRRTNGMFRSVEELASMRNRNTSELRFRALLPRVASEVELTLAQGEPASSDCLQISGRHVAVLAAQIYIGLRTFALPTTLRISATLDLVWHYVLIAGMSPSAIRVGVVATLVFAVRFLGCQVLPA